MSHNHSHSHHHHTQGEKNIKTAFFLNFIFTLLEVAGGIWTNSMAILSDALHDLGDSLSLGLAWYFEKKSAQKPDHKFSFGYARFSLLGAVINSLVLVGGSAVVLARSVPRIFAPEQVKAEGMLIFAVFGIAVNLAAMLKVSKGESYNQKTVSWHLLEDVLGWAVVLVVSIVLLFADIPIIDPLLSVGITLYVLFNAVKNLTEVVRIFLQGTPDECSIEEIETEVKQKFDIIKIYHTHIWSLDGQKNMLTTHIILGDNTPSKKITELKKDIKEYLITKGIIHATIEVEYESEKADGPGF